MNIEGSDARRHHPFGRAANWLVLGGASLSIIQSVIVGIAVVVAPLEALDLEGLALAAWLLLAIGMPAVVGWMAWRALRGWWRRSVTVVGRLLLAAVVAVPSTVLLQVPLSDEILTPVGYLPAGLMLSAAALLARPRVLRAQHEGRGGLGD